ncbi:hypothetical protein JYT53_00390 [Cytophagaceae bacterium AH-315-L13]|nr:hypothetical protein [Cytophagaceae bacterium AH-315-L13]
MEPEVTSEQSVQAEKSEQAVACPYPGLRPFNEHESLYFKGRDSHIDKMKVELEQKKFLMVTGASGDGKSSLVYAGLIPNIRAGFFKTKFNNWKIAVFRPGNDPLQNMTTCLSEQLNLQYQNVETSLKLGYSALADIYKNSSWYYDEPNNEQKKKAANLLLVVDQFEEFFTNKENFDRETAHPSETAQIIVNLIIETTKIAKEQDLPIYIVCTMRSDYIGNAPAFRRLAELIGENQYFVPRLTRSEIMQAITEPAVLSGNQITTRLAQRMLNDLNVINTDVLPVLQHALKKIWLVADKGNEQMDLRHYSMVGGILREELPDDEITLYDEWYKSVSEEKKQFYRGEKDKFKQNLNNVLNSHANELFLRSHEFYNQLNPDNPLTEEDSRYIIKTAFKCLTKIDDSKAVRNRMTLGEICDVIGDKYEESMVIVLINVFRETNNTMIYPFINKDDPVTTGLSKDSLLDITHEALIRNWNMLSNWTKEEHDSVMNFKEVQSQVYRWAVADESKDLLLTVGAYNHFNTWHEKQQPNNAWIERYLDDDIYKSDGITLQKIIDEDSAEDEIDPSKVGDLLNDFLEQSNHNILRQRRIRKQVITSISSLLVIAVIAFIWAMQLKNDMSIIAHAHKVASKASMALETDPTLSFRLAEASYNIHPTDLSKQVIMASYSKLPFYDLLIDSEFEINKVKFSPDGKYILTEFNGNRFSLWDLHGNLIFSRHRLKSDMFQNETVIFSPDGKYILSVNEDNSVSIVNIKGKEVTKLKGHNRRVNSVSMSIDRKYIITASDDKTVKLWQFDGKEIMTFYGHTDFVRLVKFSPKGNSFVSASDDNTVRIWNFNGNQLHVLNGLSFGRKYDVNYSTDGNYIITTAYDNSARLWNFKKDDLKLLKGHSDVIWSAYFSPDDKYILTSSIDNTARLWDLTGNIIQVFKAHKAKLWTAKFSADGKMIVTVSDDCTAKVWNLEGKELKTLRGHTSQLFDADFSPDNKYVVTGAFDYTARIWVIQPKENTQLLGHYSWVEDAVFSPSGKSIVTTGYDKTAKIWDRNGYLLHVLTGHTNYNVRRAYFTLGGNSILTVCGDKTARLWNLEGDELKVFHGHNGIVSKASISADGNYVLSSASAFGGTYRESILWNIEGKFIKKLLKSKVAKFSPIENFFVTEFSDNVPYFYEVVTNEKLDSIRLLTKLKKSNSDLRDVYFSSDGKFLVISYDDYTLSLFQINYSKNLKVSLIKNLKGHNGIIKSISFSKDSRFFVSTSSDKTAILWNVEGNLIKILKGHSDVVNDGAFSPDGKHIITCSYDFTLRLWDLEGNELQVYSGHTAAVVRVQFSPDGKYILSASNDQTARLIPWRVEDVLDKINVEKVRGEVWELSEKDKEVYGILD